MKRWWANDTKEYERSGGLWIAVIYPGFSWDNLQHKPAGTTLIPRRGGRFIWEQFHELSKLVVDCVYVGNVPGLPDAGTTWCPGCKKAIIERNIFSVTRLELTAGKCRFCGMRIPGVWI